MDKRKNEIEVLMKKYHPSLKKIIDELENKPNKSEEDYKQLSKIQEEMEDILEIINKPNDVAIEEVWSLIMKLKNTENKETQKEILLEIILNAPFEVDGEEDDNIKSIYEFLRTNYGEMLDSIYTEIKNSK